MVAFLEHHLNPLHVFCRLRDLGIGKTPAQFICLIYEKSFFNLFFNRIIKVRIRARDNYNLKAKSNGCWLK